MFTVTVYCYWFLTLFSLLNLQMVSNQSCSFTISLCLTQNFKILMREEQQITFFMNSLDFLLLITGYVNLLTRLLEDLRLSFTSTQPHKYHIVYTESSFQQQMGLFRVFPPFSYNYHVAEPAFVLCFVVLVKNNTIN